MTAIRLEMWKETLALKKHANPSNYPTPSINWEPITLSRFPLFNIMVHKSTNKFPRVNTVVSF
jgi:hypothetical protein